MDRKLVGTLLTLVAAWLLFGLGVPRGALADAYALLGSSLLLLVLVWARRRFGPMGPKPTPGSEMSARQRGPGLAVLLVGTSAGAVAVVGYLLLDRYGTALLAGVILILARGVTRLASDLPAGRHRALSRLGAVAGSAAPAAPRKAGSWDQWRLGAVLVLAVYAAAYLGWNLANEAPPTLCCHDSELSLFGMEWAGYAAEEIFSEDAKQGGGLLDQISLSSVLQATAHCFGANSNDLSQSPLLQPLQGLYFLATGLLPAVPHLPVLFLYLVGLACIYLLGERLHSGPAGLMAMLATLCTEEFIYRPLTWRSQDAPAAALFPLALLILLPTLGSPRPKLLRWVGAGLITLGAVMIRW